MVIKMNGEVEHYFSNWFFKSSIRIKGKRKHSGIPVTPLWVITGVKDSPSITIGMLALCVTTEAIIPSAEALFAEFTTTTESIIVEPSLVTKNNNLRRSHKKSIGYEFFWYLVKILKKYLWGHNVYISLPWVEEISSSF